MKNSIKIDPFGFREYDARWLYPDNINLEGVTNLGKGLGTQIINHTNKSNPKIETDTIMISIILNCSSIRKSFTFQN